MKTANPIVWIAVSAGLAALVLGRLSRAAPVPPPRSREPGRADPWFI